MNYQRIYQKHKGDRKTLKMVKNFKLIRRMIKEKMKILDNTIALFLNLTNEGIKSF